MSNVPRTFLLALAISLASGGAFATDRLKPVHLVFDIDWTLVSPLREADIALYKGDPRLIEVEGLHYRLSNGADVALRRLLDFNRRLGYDYVKLSFFSGGSRTRNEALLKKIVIDPVTHKTAFDIAEKVLSFENLKDHFPELSHEEKKLEFAERYQKNLGRFFEDLSRTIAIDDTPKFYRGSESKNLLWVGETYSDFPSFVAAASAYAKEPTSKYIPPNFTAWFADQNRVLIAELELESALDSEIRAAERGKAGATEFRERVRATHARSTKSELVMRLHAAFAEYLEAFCKALLLKNR